MCRYCEQLTKAIDRYILKADDDMTSRLKDEGFADPKKTVRRMNDLEDEYADALVAESKHFANEAKKAGSLEAFSMNITEIMEADALAETVAAATKKQLSETLPDLVNVYIKRTDKGLVAETITKKTTAWVTEWSEQLGQLMKLDSKKEIEGVLTKCLSQGKGVMEFTRLIMEDGIRNEYTRARRVAVTESLRAHNMAQQEAMMQSPACEDKVWRHTGNYKNEPRQNHVDMDGQRVPKGEPFVLLGADGVTYYPMCPVDSSLPAGESVNCHCIVDPIASEEILGLSLEERQQMQQEAIANMDDEWEKELNERNRAKDVPPEALAEYLASD